jgi:alkanesulfonate monooxygenase SsuD/methylene tetrahydromethanopterin reductase-like flavin-dependent oxidoreductase (luciferase family)
MSSADAVEFDAHLPLIDLGVPRSLSTLKSYVRVAVASGYRYLCANDHLVFSRPWLDGLTTLAALIEVSEDMTLVTTAGLPVVRGPVPMAKTLAALDILSAGRLVVGVGPGSTASDYAAVGVAFEERWRRFDEAVQVLGATTGRRSWRWLARLGVQHDAGSFPSGSRAACGRTRARRKGVGNVSKRNRDDLAAHHRRHRQG